MAKVKVGIVGGAGYTAGELIRILLYHPQVAISAIVSSSNAGNPVYHVHDDLVGETDLRFQSDLNGDEEVVFLCLGHGNSRSFLEKNSVPSGAKIIDLSNDFRLNMDKDVAGRSFVYGLPELNKAAIQLAQNIANPGCFATAIQLALLPLAQAGQLTDDVHVSAITGSTGAGQSLSETVHFSWRTSNVSIYKPFTHQHLGEIGESLTQLQPQLEGAIHFIPYRGNFSRGIFASVYTPSELSQDEARKLFKDFYADAPFTTVSDKEIHLKQVVNTNKCVLHVQKFGKQLLITSALDNLVKGASGQAVQNMNLLFGYPENQGLQLKSVAF
ncbi:N-acetyl-gamma-glutamyl-phosphate reductase [Hymenobacter qilianensis]|uniref:N-acetyl-gamma-glutamyl-phosphate reductase n=2 Tax=Hymenobacter qilianensis TaxID=1385715 RepID=A0A7H0GRI4_9BACT|nr:N-acetyl-gamma-glutamyl-phosphate reductase [Hymenobacter qilianensis]QNP50900.1 N-acetyl-gamma-glutamyl-phosphate reductase [Hymenobacter qilianensis]GGF49690.1 N-acetyl-gamma-glutamyl-phosphate reductase [Hymenobacter qilianensis]